MRINTCLKCGSNRMVPNAMFYDEGPLKAVFDANPSAWFFKGRVKSELRAVICGDCGFTELYVSNPEKIYEAFQPPNERVNASVGASDHRFTDRFLQHPDKVYDEFPTQEAVQDTPEERCLKCGAEMPDVISTCETCGWTYRTESPA